ncbi:hypothetical protein D3C71_1308690 [compost metagenome]
MRHRIGTEDLTGKPAGDHRGDHRTEVDAHVEDREARIAAHVALQVQLADQGRDDRLEQTVADDDGRQAQLEQQLGRRGQHEQADRHEQRAQQNRTLEADQFVSDIAAEDGTGVHQRQVGAVQLACRLFTGGLAAMELGHDVQHHRPPDAVERKAFPEFGHEQHPQGTRMAQKGLELRQRRFGNGFRGGVYAHAGFLGSVEDMHVRCAKQRGRIPDQPRSRQIHADPCRCRRAR